MRELVFEWDDDKAAANLTKHGVSFARAAAIFSSAIVEKIDAREDYGELRFIALGRVDLTIYKVVYTWRGNRWIRIIIAQKANRHERESYHSQVYS